MEGKYFSIHGKISFVFGVCGCFLLIGASALAASLFDEARPRDKTWEFSFHPNFIETQTLDFEGGSNVELESTTGWGLWWGYNLNNHFNLGIDTSWAQPNAKVTIASADFPGLSRTISGDFSSFTLSAQGTFNLLQGPLTPYVSAGIGWTEVTAEIARLPPVGGCWWDPWWGYACGYSYPTYANDSVSYLGGLGVRWDIGSSFFTRVSWNRQWVEIGDETPGIDAYKLDLGFKF